MHTQKLFFSAGSCEGAISYVKQAGAVPAVRERTIGRDVCVAAFWAEVSLKIAETEQPYQGKRIIVGIGDMLFSIYSQTENGKDPKVSLVNL